MPTLLDIFAQEKRDQDFGKNILFADDIEDSYYINYTDNIGEFSNPYSQGDIVRESRSINDIADERLLDISSFNIYEPEEGYIRFSLEEVGAIIDSFEIEDVASVQYEELIAKNCFKPENRVHFSTQPFTELQCYTDYDNYLDYINFIQNNRILNGTNIVEIFLGQNNFEDSPIGTIGSNALKDALQLNFETSLARNTIGRVNATIFDLIQDRTLIQRDYKITQPDTTLEQIVQYTQRLQGTNYPFYDIPSNIWDLENNSSLTTEERMKLLFNYTGRGVRKIIKNFLDRNDYSIFIDDENERINGFYYVFYDGQAYDKRELNAKYILTDLAGFESEYGTQSGIPVFTRNYGIIINDKKKSNKFLIDIDTPSYEDDSPFVNDWSVNTENNFVEKSLLYKIKQKLLDEGQFSMLNNFNNEFKVQTVDGEKILSKGSTITAANSFTADDGVSFKANDYFRVFHKGRQYNRLSRTLRHRGLDNGDKRSVLSDNGIPIYAPTKRIVAGQEVIYKNYMFSISNAAWKGRGDELPECEKYRDINGNIYRQMWFAPYDLQISESTSQNISTHNFIGRPEPIYTTINSERDASISFALLIDHPDIIKNTGFDKTHIWERYLRGDKSVEEQINRLIERRLSPNEITQIKRLKQLNEAKKKKSSEPVYGDKQGDQLTGEKNNEQIEEEILLFSVYFPNESSVIPPPKETELITLNAGYEANNNPLGYTYLNGLQKTSPQYRDSISYSLNEQLYSINEALPFAFETLFNDESITNIKIIVKGYSSAAITSRISNYSLAEQRGNNVLDFFNQKYQELNIDAKNIYNIEITTEVRTIGDVADLQSETPTQDDDFGDSFQAKIFRRADLLLIVTRETDDVENSISDKVIREDELNDDPNLEDFEPILANNNIQIDENILRKLFYNPCDYFDFLEINEPALHSTINEKIRYFHPAFFSQTPQDFNTRLNFLQQCLRPANTIGLNNGAPTNLNFGYQSIVYLQIGDWFRTKAIITNLSIDYNAYNGLHFDINPESEAGVQPLFAKVTLNLKIIGGQTMNGALNRLQNALSFNFYSNTEMYDARSDSLSLETRIDPETNELIEEAKIIDGLKLNNIYDKNNLEQRKNEGEIEVLQGRFAQGVDPPQVNPVTTSSPQETDLDNLRRQLGLNVTNPPY